MPLIRTFLCGGFLDVGRVHLWSLSDGVCGHTSSTLEMRKFWFCSIYMLLAPLQNQPTSRSILLPSTLTGKEATNMIAQDGWMFALTLQQCSCHVCLIANPSTLGAIPSTPN